MQTGQRIAELRIKAEMTQEQLAQRLFVSQQLVSAWENGTRRPDLHSLEKMAEVFSVETDDLCCINEAIINELSECIPENKDVNIHNLNNILNDFLSEISEKERKIFVRRYYFLEDSAEIAYRFRLKDNYVRTVLSRVRKKLKKYLTEVQ